MRRITHRWRRSLLPNSLLGMPRSAHAPVRSQAYMRVMDLPRVDRGDSALPHDQPTPDEGNRAAPRLFCGPRFLRALAHDPQRERVAGDQYVVLLAASRGLARHGQCGAHGSRLSQPVAGAGSAAVGAAGSTIPDNPKRKLAVSSTSSCQALLHLLILR